MKKMLKVISIITSFMLLISCSADINIVTPSYLNTKNTATNENNIVDISLTPYAKQIKDAIVSWRLQDGSKVKENADNLIGGKLCVGYSKDMPEYDVNDTDAIDWNMSVGQFPETYQMYLQSLIPVLYLTKAYEDTGNEKYMDLATNLIKSWKAYVDDGTLSSENEWVWNDHGTAMRTEHLIYYTVVGLEKGYLSETDAAEIASLVKAHAEKLSKENFYTKNHNHGVNQDKALMLAAYFLNDKNSADMLALAKERLQKQWDFEFTSEMMNTENSFGYHIYNINLFDNLINFLSSCGDAWGKAKAEDLKICEDVTGLMIKPQGVSSGHGDTHISTYSDTTGREGGVLEYVTSKGMQGKKPDKTSQIFPEAGYYIARETWEPENFEDSSWTMFKSGFLSKGHKHADDTSFQYSAKGHNIFVDPGFLGYTSNDTTAYLRSSEAHNMVSVKGAEYDQEPDNVGITFYDVSEDKPYDYVLGFNNSFEGVELKRHFINFKESIFLIDECMSQNEQTYEQNFQLGPDMRIVSASDNEVLMKIGDTDYYVRIRQLNNNASLEILEGAEGTPYGLYSPKGGELEFITTLRFSLIGKNEEFATLVTVEDKNGNNTDISNFEWDRSNRTFKYTDNGDGEYTVDLK